MTERENSSSSFSRRKFLQLSAVGVTGLLIGCRNDNQNAGRQNSNAGTNTAISADQNAAVQTGKATFVLIHGAWHGGWCWKKVAPLLEAAGHRVFTPTLTGLGERAHLNNSQVNLSTHIEDVAAVLEYEDLRDVILVGHSYAGFVISGARAKAGNRIGKTVYFDALLPTKGKSFKDGAPDFSLAEMVKKPNAEMLKMFGVTDPADVEWMLPRLTAQPPGTFTEPAEFTAETSESLPRIFIQTSELFAKEAAQAKKQNFRFYELLAAGHDAMVTKPQELVKLFLELV